MTPKEKGMKVIRHLDLKHLDFEISEAINVALQEQAKEIKEELMLDFANWDRECEFMNDIELIIRNNKYIKALTRGDKNADD